MHQPMPVCAPLWPRRVSQQAELVLIKKGDAVIKPEPQEKGCGIPPWLPQAYICSASQAHAPQGGPTLQASGFCLHFPLLV